MANLNEYRPGELKNLYKIIKAFVSIASRQFLSDVYLFFYDNLEQIIESILLNLANCKSEVVVYMTGKILRKLFKNKVLYRKILNFRFFSEIYFYTKSEKFVISTEAFKILTVNRNYNFYISRL